MSTFAENLGLGSFACEFGDLQRSPETIADYAAICAAKGIGLSLSMMGCDTFWQMTRPIESYITSCVAKTLAAGEVAPERVNYVVFSTTDQNLRYLDESFTRKILEHLGLVNCIPVFVSMQQCASSLAALNYGYLLFGDASVSNVIVVAFDFVVDDSDRIKPFALFGDAVASCMISRGGAAGLSLSSYAVSVDYAGLQGRDNFESRKRVATATLGEVLKESGARLADIEKFFSTNVYKPLALFNASACGVTRNQLYIDTMRSRAHCGNCDWMINLAHYQEQSGLAGGKKYLIHSSAPGFFACGLLESTA